MEQLNVLDDSNNTSDSKKLATVFSWQSLSKLSPEIIWVFVGQAGTIMAGLFGIKLLTYVLNPHEFGKLVLANTIVTFVSTILFSPLGQGLMRFWSISQKRGDLETFYAVSDRYGRNVVVISIFVTIGLVFTAGLTKGIDLTLLLGLSLVVGTFSGWLGLRISIFTAIRQRRRVALIDMGTAFLRPVIAAFLVILITSNAVWAMVGYLLATFLILLKAESLYYQTISETSSSSLQLEKPVFLSHDLGKEIFSFSWPLAFWGIFTWVYMSCDRWALQTFYGADVVGSFVVVSQLALYPLNFGSTFLNILFTPISFQRAGDFSDRLNVISSHKLLYAMMGIYTFGAVILIALFAIFHRPLVLLISNDSFAKLSSMLPGLTAALALYCLGQMLFSFGLLVNQPLRYIMPKLLSSIVAGGSTFYLTGKVGPVGVVWGLALAGFIYAFWCVFVTWKLVLKEKYNL